MSTFRLEPHHVDADPARSLAPRDHVLPGFAGEGRGRIGLAGFRNLVNDPRLADVPMILETPKGTDDQGRASLLGHSFSVDRHWLHRLVRAEVDLDEKTIRFFALRRREPIDQPLLKSVPYALPSRSFKE